MVEVHDAQSMDVRRVLKGRQTSAKSMVEEHDAQSLDVRRVLKGQPISV
jgi:hypothetical protein